MDVRTGEVMAQASYPTFDAADQRPDAVGPLDDAVTSEVFDPGSVHKAIVMGAALEEGMITPDSTVTIDSTVTKGDTAYTDTAPDAVGTLMTLPGHPGVLVERRHHHGRASSSARRSSTSTSASSVSASATGDRHAGESSGLVRPPDRWSGSSYGSIPIGNGVR